jgi:uncharacterized membrane protein YkvI
MEILGSGQMMKSHGSKYVVLNIMHVQGLVFVLGGQHQVFRNEMSTVLISKLIWTVKHYEILDE